jgi:CubicO group peptidase (beta-lactamase class C family)
MGEDDSAALAAWLDECVPPLMARWRVPGLSLCVVGPRGAPILRAWGEREAARGAPMRVDTPLPVASMSKAFTTTAFALAVGRGEVAWEARVRDVVPELQLADGHAAEQLTVLDMLSHRSGLPRHDGVWIGQQMTPAQLLAVLAHVAPSRGLRECFQYQNLMYALSGLVLERATGRSWADCVADDVMRPLRMARSAPLVSRLAARAALAAGHSSAGAVRSAVRAVDLGVMGPTGGVISCASDMACFIALQLGLTAQTLQVGLAAADRQLMHSPQTALDWPMSPAEFEAQAYGLGWFCARYRGAPLVHHGGNLEGFSSHMALLPQQRCGFALLLNEGRSPLRDVLANLLTDRLIGAAPLPWSQRYQELLRGMRAAKRVSARRIAGVSKLALHHPAYGTVTVHHSRGAYKLEILGRCHALGSLQGDTFRLPATAPHVWAARTVHLLRDAQGGLCALHAVLEPLAPAIRFEALADTSSASAAAQAPPGGCYVLGPLRLRIDECANGGLLMSRTTAPRRRLRPMADGSWHVLGGRAESVRWIRDARSGAQGLLYRIADDGFFLQRDDSACIER